MTPAGELRTGPPKKDDGRATNTWLRYSHLGIQFALTLLICVFAGTWADRKFGIDPWGTIVGSLFGIAASMYSIIKAVGR